jgi:hypothetical protein
MRGGAHCLSSNLMHDYVIDVENETNFASSPLETKFVEKDARQGRNFSMSRIPRRPLLSEFERHEKSLAALAIFAVAHFPQL